MSRAEDVQEFIRSREIAEHGIATEVRHHVSLLDLGDVAIEDVHVSTVLLPGEILPLAADEKPRLRVQITVVVTRAEDDGKERGIL